MQLRTSSAAAFAPVLAGLAVALAAPAAGAASVTAPTITTAALPLTGFTSIAADTEHHREFISGGSADSSIVVADDTGKVTASIPNETGASSLALSSDRRTLYAALPGAGAISAIDTATLQEIARYSTGAGIVPRYVAAVGRTAWFGYDHGSVPGGGIGYIDQRHGTAVLTPTNVFYYAAPMVAAATRAPGVLLTGDASSDPSVVAEYDVASGSPVLAAKTNPWSTTQCDTVTGLAFTPDGHDAVVTCGAPYHATSYSLNGLVEDGTYQTGPYTSAVAVADDGEIAVGMDAISSTVDVFSPGNPAPVASYSVGGSSLMNAFGVYGLAWGAHDRELFAVTRGVYGDNVELNTIDFDTH